MPQDIAMSRSAKKRPFHGIVCCASEKRDKRFANRALRRAVRVALDQGVEPPTRHETSDPWCFGKDGKTRFDPTRLPELLRK